MNCVFGFFFSSRRRHTRWTGDWSSDVCSSDLGGRGDLGVARRDPPRAAPALLRPRQARLLSEPVPGQQHQRPQAQERPDRRRWDLHQASADPGRMGRDPGPGPDRLQARYNRLVRRFGEDKNPAARKKAITAIAHTLLKIAYQVLKS